MQIFYFFLITGIILVTLDIITTTFYLFVIGIAFILSGLLALIFDNWLIVTIISGGLSVIGCIIIRLYKQRHNGSEQLLIKHIGQNVEVIEILNDKLRVAYSGSYWDAKLAKKDIKNINIGDILTITKYSNNALEID